MEPIVCESVRYVAECQDCGAELECWGTQALVQGRLEWDVVSSCAACGSAFAVCFGDIPSERRAQLLSEHGAATLRVIGPSARRVVIMRVLRAELGTDLAGAKSVLGSVLEGGYSGTLPEMELLARKLRAAGITAEATRP
ncbi:hypothetical protein ABZ916_16090 [Streptomyces sp. NPDC046853]|uniref:hypothetical protein n=1 Tax=Streptomyces sp. NPDC046853 TaxID=3154920 RepID=UPI0033CE1EFC